MFSVLCVYLVGVLIHLLWFGKLREYLESKGMPRSPNVSVETINREVSWLWPLFWAIVIVMIVVILVKGPFSK